MSLSDRSEYLEPDGTGRASSPSCVDSRVDASQRIAIVGAGGIFPGAPDLDSFWANIANGVDTGRRVPPDRWYLSPETAFVPNTAPRTGTLEADPPVFLTVKVTELGVPTVTFP